MNLIMTQRRTKRRKLFLALPDFLGTVVDRDFDNDNHPVTGELLDWYTCRQYPRLT